jgi:hypothetical protein
VAPHRSTLADANANRPAGLFCDLFEVLLKQAHPHLRRATREAVHLIDATSIRLSALSRDWARKDAENSAVKIHVDYSADGGVPVHFRVTHARINDISPAKELQIAPGESYVFDLGYYDFTWFSRLHQAGCRFVTRLKTHTRPRLIEARPVSTHGPIRADKLIRIDGRLKSLRPRRNPLANVPLREVVVVIDTGKTLRILTNDVTSPAEEIAALYKARWQIELFFRWIKQHLKIKRFLGTSENAVRTQIAVALIAYLLLRIAANAVRVVPSLLTFQRLVATNLMHLKNLRDLDKPPDRFRPDHRQHELALC